MSGALGVKVAVAPEAETVAVIGVAAPAASSVNVVGVKLAAVMLELKVAVNEAFTEIPVAAAAGLMDRTLGAPAVVKVQA